jgi:hypothetical protein
MTCILSTCIEIFQIKMLTIMKQLSVLVVIGVLFGCTVSDGPPPTPASPTPAVAQAAEPGAGSVQINGLSQFRQTALVVSDQCRSFSYLTDRQEAARASITRALQDYASALPGGLRVDVQSLKVRMRCHTAGAGALGSYCAADTSLTLAAIGNDRGGREISVTATKEVTDRVSIGFILGVQCADGMPAITSAVDRVLAETLANVQNGLAARTGIPAR